MIYYLCDGYREECCDEDGNGSISCFRNGGDCYHTADILHAKNFKRIENCGISTTTVDFWEQPIAHLEEENGQEKC